MLRYQKYITIFYWIFPLMGGNFAWSQTNTSASSTCSPYHYFENTSACSFQKNTSLPHSVLPPSIRNYKVDHLKEKKKLMAQITGAPTSIEDAFPNLSASKKTANQDSSSNQQNHIEFTSWQIIIDKSFSHFFKLKSLANINTLCKSLPLSSEQFAIQLGVSDGLAEKIHSQCLTINPQAQTDFFGNQIANKFYIFVKLDENFPEDKNFPFTGWTDAANTTYLFIRPTTTWGDLELALIHELAIGMDSKKQLSWPHFISLFSPKISVPITYNIEKQWSKLFNMSLLPEIQYAFTAMRANRIMKMAFDEVRQKNANSEVISTKSNFISSFISTFSTSSSENQSTTDKERESLVEEFQFFVEQAKSWKIPQGAETPVTRMQNTFLNHIKAKYPNLDEAVKTVIDEKTKIIFHEENNRDEKVDFFIYMATPLFGKKSNQTFRAGGPGCGYCGGSYKEEDIDQWNNFWDQKIEDTSAAQPSTPEGDLHE